MTDALAVAVDVGASKVAVGIVDQSGRVRERIQEALVRRGGDAAVRQVVRMADRLAHNFGASGVGVAVPAVVDEARRHVVWAPNIRGWRGIPLAAAVEDAVGLPTWLEYDGHAATLGEHWVGAGRGVRNFVMLVIGTGIGGGMILDGHLYRGTDGLAGAAGWLTSGTCAPRDPGASAAHTPALETVAAGPAVARRALRDDRRAEGVFSAAEAGDAASQQVLDDTATTIGLAVADIVSLLNPQLVALGGGMGAGASGARLLPRIRRAVREHAQPVAARRARVVRSRLGANAGLIGAAHGVFLQLSGIRSHTSGRF